MCWQWPTTGRGHQQQQSWEMCASSLGGHQQHHLRAWRLQDWLTSGQTTNRGHNHLHKIELKFYTSQCVLLAKLLKVFALLHLVLQGQTYLSLQVSLDFLLCIPVLMMKRTSFILVLVPQGHHRTIQLQLLQH